MTRAHPYCPHCKYDLSGIDPGLQTFPCPECGKMFDRRDEPGVVHFDGKFVMTRVCWPAWAAIAIAEVARVASRHETPLILLAFAAVFVTPWIMAAQVVRRYLPSAERAVPFVLMGIVGCFLNLFVFGVAAWITWHM